MARPIGSYHADWIEQTCHCVERIKAAEDESAKTAYEVGAEHPFQRRGKFVRVVKTAGCVYREDVITGMNLGGPFGVGANSHRPDAGVHGLDPNIELVARRYRIRERFDTDRLNSCC